MLGALGALGVAAAMAAGIAGLAGGALALALDTGPVVGPSVPLASGAAARVQLTPTLEISAQTQSVPAGVFTARKKGRKVSILRR